MSLDFKRFQQRLQGAKTGLLNQVDTAVDTGIQTLRTSLTTMFTNIGTRIDQFTDMFVANAKHGANGTSAEIVGTSLAPTNWVKVISYAPGQGTQNALMSLDIECQPIIETTPTVNYGILLTYDDYVVSDIMTYTSVSAESIYEIKSYAKGDGSLQWTPQGFATAKTIQQPSVSRTSDLIANDLSISIPLFGVRAGTKGIAVWVWDGNKGSTWTSIKLRYRA